MDEAKTKECLEKIEAILKEYDVSLQTTHGITIVPKPQRSVVSKEE